MITAKLKVPALFKAEGHLSTYCRLDYPKQVQVGWRVAREQP